MTEITSDFAGSPEGLTRKTTRGVFWTGTSQLVVQAVGFALNIFVARLLFPEDFGVLGMAAIFIELVSLVSDLGLNTAIIQRRDVSQTQLSTCFWLNGMVGVLLFGCGLLCAPLVAELFRKDIVGPVIMLSSMGFILRSMGSLHRALLTRQLAFRTLAIPEIVGIVVFGICVVALAWRGAGLWSVIIANLVSAAATTLLLWLLNPWRPGYRFNWSETRPLMPFSANVVGEQLLDYVNLNVDYLLIGRLLGAAALGTYTLAFNLMTFPLRKIAQMITRVTFPAFSQIQEDEAALRHGYLASVRYIALVTFPILTGMGILAPDFIPLVYTEKWEDAILPLQIMCVDGLVRTVSTTTGSVLYAKGRSDVGFKWKMVTVLVIPPAVVFATPYGIVGVSIAITAATLVLAPIIQGVTHRLIHLKWRDFGRALAPATICSLLMAGWLMALVWTRSEFWPTTGYAFLGTAVLSSMALYTAGFWLLFRTVFAELMGLFGHLRT